MSLRASTILRLVALLLLFISFCSILFGHGYHFSLKTLLETLTSLPQVEMSDILQKLTISSITSDWGVFDFLRDFINSCIAGLNGAWSFVAFLGVGFSQLLMLFVSLFSGL